MKRKNKKSTILYVLKILEEASSPRRPITQQLITKTINLAGISCDRKTVARDIDCLIEFGYIIVKIKGGGCYMVSNREKFRVQDYRLISSCIKTSNLATEKKIELCYKLKSLINVIEM